VSNAVSLTSGVAGRYATALFEIGRDGKRLDKIEADLAVLQAALAESPDLRAMIASPVHTRDEQMRAIAALAGRMGLSTEVANTLGLMGHNRRLFVLPRMIAQLKALIAQERGEVSAEVASARPLTEAQTAALAATLKATVGKDVTLRATVDESLIGGLVVRVGSQMIDTSIRSKLASLQTLMKEVG
jgi:F-type H+-transporting ATPase subunit delta